MKRQPCSNCGSSKFGVIKHATLQFNSSAKKDGGTTVNPQFGIAVCVGCGATQLFSTSGRLHLFEMCYHDIVDVDSGSHYR